MKHLPDGVSLPKLFGVLDLVERPAVDRLRLARVPVACIPALGHRWVHDTLAVAVGDAFGQAEITPYECAQWRPCAA